MSIVVAENLTYDYPGTRALDGVSFAIPRGTITALVGPNGAGKTTLLRCLAVLDRPLRGRILIDGVDTADDPRACHRRLGYLADDFGLYGDLSVRRCLTYHAAIRGLAGAARAAAIERVVGQLELAALIDRRPDQLSRGQRQRVGIAQAIIHSPAVLLLDEPATGLDPEARWKLSSLIAALARGGMTLVVSSHILTELEDYSTHVMIVRGGTLALHKPLAEAVAALAGAGPGAAGRAETAMHVELAAVAPEFEAVLKQFKRASRIAVHGASATVFIPDGGEPRAALLRHCVEAGLAVIGYGEDRARVQEVYFAAAAGKEVPRDRRAEPVTAPPKARR
jgi:ABC-2 type transport system ATP-binding protein